MKISLVGAELSYADGETGSRDELTVAFHSFASAPKNRLTVKYQLFTGLHVTKFWTAAALQQRQQNSCKCEDLKQK
jgi:hypothetical protein